MRSALAEVAEWLVQKISGRCANVGDSDIGRWAVRAASDAE
jgi:hypothetical protein